MAKTGAKNAWGVSISNRIILVEVATSAMGVSLLPMRPEIGVSGGSWVRVTLNGPQCW